MKPWLALQLEDVARPDDVRRPQRLVVLLAVDAAELGRQVVDEVDRAGPLEQLLELAVGPDVRADHLLVGLVLQIAAQHVVPAPAQLGDERTPERALRAGDQDLRHFGGAALVGDASV